MDLFVDLHCHWIADIDDGAEACPKGSRCFVGYARPASGLWSPPRTCVRACSTTEKADLEAAYQRMLPQLDGQPGLPEVALSSEHFFDDIVFSRLMRGEGIPYPGGRAALIEFPSDNIPTRVADRLFDLRRKGLRL